MLVKKLKKETLILLRLIVLKSGDSVPHPPVDPRWCDLNGQFEYNRIQTQLTGLLAEKLNVEVPSEETDLFETGILDSQKFVELLLHIEQTVRHSYRY